MCICSKREGCCSGKSLRVNRWSPLTRASHCLTTAAATLTRARVKASHAPQGSHQIQNWMSLREVCVLVLGLLMFLSAVSLGSS